MEHIDDKILIEGCLKNDRISQRMLYEKYAPGMFGICMRYTNCKDEAEDILIEGFVNVFKHIDSFRSESSLGPWIKKIMINNAISHYRKYSKHYYIQHIDEIAIDIMDDTINVDDSFSQKDILEIIQKMPEHLRIVLNMRAFEALEYSEIAEKLNIAEATCRSRFAKAKKWIEELLKPKN